MLLRKFIVTTALSTMVATAAFAQTTTTAPASTTAMAMSDDALASNIIGQNVYNGGGQDADKIGDVNDLLIGKDGMVKSVIVGVGGFLGMGEKDVALNYSDFKWTTGTDANGAATGNRWLVANTTKESLQGMPAFDRSMLDGQAAANAPAAGTAMTSAADTGATAPSDATQPAAMDRSKMTPMAADKLTAENLIGTNVYGANDAKVGEIADIVLDQSKKIDAVLIDVGGFLGIGAKRIAVGMDNLSFMQDADGDRYLYSKMTKDQLKAQPEYNADTYSANRDTQRMTVQ